MSIKKIGVLTGGGDCPGLNAVLRALVKSAIGVYGWEVTGFKDGFRGLVENWTMPLTQDSVSGIITRGGTILGTNNRANPHQYTYGADGKNIPPVDRSRDAINNLNKAGIDALVVIGGDGTLSCAQRFANAGVNVIGIPKTIDNDLNATDVTFGFDSALTVATEAVDRLHTTAESHHRVMVVEIMGRYAGWLALRSGIAGGGDIILIPEIPYDMESIFKAVKKRVERGRNFTIIVASEGARSKTGEMVVQKKVEGSPDPIRLGGVSYRIGEAVEKATGIESRVTILGHLQRGGSPTAFDRWLATRFGVKAAEILHSGETGRMASLKGTNVVSVHLKEAISSLRLVDPEGEEVRTARSTGVSFGD